MLDRPDGNVHGGHSRGMVHGKCDLCPQRHELIHRGGAVDVRSRQERVTSLLLEVPRQLRTECRLAGSLQTRDQNNRGWGCSLRNRGRGCAQESYQLFMDDPDDKLARRDALQHFLTERLLPDIFNELLCYFEVDVRIK